jgi:hypothetical protein
MEHGREGGMRMRIAMAVVVMLALTIPASGQLYLELGGSPVRNIPPDGSPWHELFPNFCIIHNQDAYGDNGDGVVSVCDMITLDGVPYHITWTGPTYYLYGDAGPAFYEPTGEPGGSPVGQIWHEVAPNFCTEHQVTDWEDADGDGEVSQCDTIVFADGTAWHVEEIRLDITATPGSPVEDSTWGRIKAAIGRMF